MSTTELETPRQSWPGSGDSPGVSRRNGTAAADGPRTAWGERAGLLALLAGTAVLYVVGLSSSGWANQFYAAAAQAGSKSWTAFLFGSLDASNFITVDKP